MKVHVKKSIIKRAFFAWIAVQIGQSNSRLVLLQPAANINFPITINFMHLIWNSIQYIDITSCDISFSSCFSSHRGSYHNIRHYIQIIKWFWIMKLALQTQINESCWHNMKWTQTAWKIIGKIADSQMLKTPNKQCKAISN